MARRLAKAVVVPGKRGKGNRLFLPGDTVPPDVAEFITNPYAWADDDEPETDDTEAEAEVEVSEDADDAEGSAEQPAPASEVPVPAKSERGSGIDAWRSYAVAHDVDLEDDMSRDDIIAACELAEVPTA